MKKILSMILTVCMLMSLLSVIPTTVSAQETDIAETAERVPEDYSNIKAGETKEVSIDTIYSPGAEKWFRFAPDADMLIHIYADGFEEDKPVAVSLYDESMKQLDSALCYADSVKYIERAIHAGEVYYIESRFWNYDTGSFDLVIEQLKTPDITLGGSLKVSFDDNIRYYRFDSKSDKLVSFKRPYDVFINLYDDSLQELQGFHDSYYEGDSDEVESSVFHVKANTTYYFTVHNYTDYSAVTVTLNELSVKDLTFGGSVTTQFHTYGFYAMRYKATETRAVQFGLSADHDFFYYVCDSDMNSIIGSESDYSLHYSDYYYDSSAHRAHSTYHYLPFNAEAGKEYIILVRTYYVGEFATMTLSSFTATDIRMNHLLNTGTGIPGQSIVYRFVPDKTMVIDIQLDGEEGDGRFWLYNSDFAQLSDSDFYWDEYKLNSEFKRSIPVCAGKTYYIETYSDYNSDPYFDDSFMRQFHITEHQCLDVNVDSDTRIVNGGYLRVIPQEDMVIKATTTLSDGIAGIFDCNADRIKRDTNNASVLAIKGKPIYFLTNAEYDAVTVTLKKSYSLDALQTGVQESVTTDSEHNYTRCFKYTPDSDMTAVFSVSYNSWSSSDKITIYDSDHHDVAVRYATNSTERISCDLKKGKTYYLETTGLEKYTVVVTDRNKLVFNTENTVVFDNNETERLFTVTSDKDIAVQFFGTTPVEGGLLDSNKKMIQPFTVIEEEYYNSFSLFYELKAGKTYYLSLKRVSPTDKEIKIVYRDIPTVTATDLYEKEEEYDYYDEYDDDYDDEYDDEDDVEEQRELSTMFFQFKPKKDEHYAVVESPSLKLYDGSHHEIKSYEAPRGSTGDTDDFFFKASSDAALYFALEYSRKAIDLVRVPEIKLNETKTVKSSNQNTIAYYAFTPTASTSVKYYSMGDLNAWGRVIVASTGTKYWASVVDKQFIHRFGAKKGETYYLKSLINHFYDYTPGTYQVKIEEIPEFEMDGTKLTKYNGTSENPTIPSTVTDIEYTAFMNSSSIAKVTLPDKIKSIKDYAFAECENLEEIKLPKNLTAIGEGVLANCPSLDSIDIPDTVQSIGRKAFMGDSSLKKVDIPNKVTSIGENAFNGDSNLSEVNIGSSVKTIGKQAFLNCPSLESVTIPASVTEIGDYAFGYEYVMDYYGPPAMEQIDGFVIKGAAGSAAETYARENGFTFIATDGTPTPPTEKPTEKPTTKPTEKPVSPLPEIICGDSDKDGDITILDATAIQRYLAELSTISFDASAADADEDGDITILDATSIQRYLAELPTAALNIGKLIYRSK